MDRILTSGEIIDFMESRSIGPISGSAELFLLCQIAYELKLAKEEREAKSAMSKFAHGGIAPNSQYIVGEQPNPPITDAFVTGLSATLPARHPETIVDKSKRRK